jgi:hypothetical protein
MLAARRYNRHKFLSFAERHAGKRPMLWFVTLHLSALH